ncbi:acyl-CoA dehydrogenase family protein [Paenibacillus kobensis]|uniref:acyl-CoA dehydrogenase family protein n=1 Tax=Paenibacillus kobensis TaxID=59841 RepID=UPI000FD91DA4|nr:acyl-CoA dehydrogenase family protein [Paenibacillus kobensis]
MRFELPEELEMLRSVVREFAEAEVAPGASGRDEEERFDRPLFAKMAALGLTGIPVPERYGGSGGGWLAYAIVLEELSRVCASTASALAAHTSFAVWPLYRYGSDAIREQLLVPFASGASLAGAGLLEMARPPGLLPIDQQLYAVDENDEGFSLEGTHPFVVNAGEADGYLLFAASRQSRRLQAAWINRNTDGLTIGKRIHKLGLRSFATGELSLSECRVPASHTLGRDGRAREMVQPIATAGMLSAAAQSVGVAQGALDAATAYAKERKQFGAPIGRQQSILFKLADMSVAIEASRWLTYQAAWRLDEGASGEHEAALARNYAADSAVRAALEGVQIMGGYGYMREYKLERLLRDAKCIETAIAVGGMDHIAPQQNKPKPQR